MGLERAERGRYCVYGCSGNGWDTVAVGDDGKVEVWRTSELCALERSSAGFGYRGRRSGGIVQRRLLH